MTAAKTFAYVFDYQEITNGDLKIDNFYKNHSSPIDLSMLRSVFREEIIL